MFAWQALVGRWPTLVAALVLIVLGTVLADNTNRAEFAAAMLLSAGLMLLGVHLGAAFTHHHEHVAHDGESDRETGDPPAVP